MTTFNELAIGSAFRALRNDIVGKGILAKIVLNTSIYVKVGNNVSVDVKTNKDCIFHLTMPVAESTHSIQVGIEKMDSFIACNHGG